MGKYTEKRLAGLIRMKALQSNESSHVHRVRASREVNEWFKELTAEERGGLITSLYLFDTGVTSVASLRELDAQMSRDQDLGVTPVESHTDRPERQPGRVKSTRVTPVKAVNGDRRSSTRVTPVKLRGKVLDLYNLLLEGGEMVAIGHEYGVVKEGKTVATFKGATGGALITREGLLTRTGPSSWVLSSLQD